MGLGRGASVKSRFQSPIRWEWSLIGNGEGEEFVLTLSLLVKEMYPITHL